MNKVEELRQHLAQVKERQKELDTEYTGEVFPVAAQEEFDSLRAGAGRDREGDRAS
jgi:hypothetical protein